MSTPTVRTCNRCGETRHYQTEALANRSWPKHPCDKIRAKRDRKAAHAARLAATSIKVDCTCPTVHHEHGTMGAYTTDHCTCTDCRAWSARYQADQNRLKAYGRWNRWADPAPVRAHLRMLGEHGIGWKQVASVAGVANPTVTAILYGSRRADGTIRPTDRVGTHIAAKLLAVQPALEAAHPNGRWPMGGSTLRLRALCAMGWNLEQITTELGWAHTTTDRIVHARHERTTVKHVLAVRNVYERLSMTFPPQTTRWEKQVVTRARNAAARNGWAPPLALDDDRLDDPTYKVDPTWRRTRTIADWSVLLDDWAELRDQGVSLTDAADRLGVTFEALDKATGRAKRAGDPRGCREPFARDMAEAS